MRVALITLLTLSAACTGPSRLTPLALAARHGDAAQIAALAAAGHDVNAFDAARNRWTPLLHAIHKGQRTSVDALIAAGADVNRSAPGSPSPLLMAAGNGQADIVRRLLTAGANPRRDGETLLAVAVSGGAFTDIENPLLGRCNTEVVRALLERAPDLRLRDNLRGRVARWFARLNSCSDVIHLTAAPA
jgi:ankyrin repeat protein